MGKKSSQHPALGWPPPPPLGSYRLAAGVTWWAVSRRSQWYRIWSPSWTGTLSAPVCGLHRLVPFFFGCFWRRPTVWQRSRRALCSLDLVLVASPAGLLCGFGVAGPAGVAPVCRATVIAGKNSLRRKKCIVFRCVAAAAGPRRTSRTCHRGCLVLPYGGVDWPWLLGPSRPFTPRAGWDLVKMV